jgi:hypothetical protein
MRNCKYWKDEKCVIGRYDGSPTETNCNGCIAVKLEENFPGLDVTKVQSPKLPSATNSSSFTMFPVAPAASWDDVKKAYAKDWPEGLAEIELMEQEWTPAPGGCTSCEMKARIRRYMERLQVAVKAKQEVV